LLLQALIGERMLSQRTLNCSGTVSALTSKAFRWNWKAGMIGSPTEASSSMGSFAPVWKYSAHCRWR
jgi:hypothetical protein